jgi:AmiR/NasT family two-component response regulator
VQDDQLRACIDLAWRRYHHYSADRAENRSLKKRLEERKVVEQAKWILVSTRNMTEPDAMRLLRTRSRDSRRSMAQLAETIIKQNGLKD